jgi:hypothetical protein
MIDCKNVQVPPMQQWSEEIEEEKGRRKRRKKRRGRWSLFYSAGSGLSVNQLLKPSYPVYQVKKKPKPLSLPNLPVKFRASTTKGLDGGTRSD